MKPNGKIFVAVPFIIKAYQKPFDYLRYTNFMLEYLLKDVGFIEVNIEEMGNAFDIYRILKPSQSQLKMKFAVKKVWKSLA